MKSSYNYRKHICFLAKGGNLDAEFHIHVDRFIVVGGGGGEFILHNLYMHDSCMIVQLLNNTLLSKIAQGNMSQNENILKDFSSFHYLNL